MITSIHIVTGSGYSRLEYVDGGRTYRCWYHEANHATRARNAAKVLRLSVCGF